MATKKMPQGAEHVKPVEPGTPELEALLQAGYGFDIEEAKRIVAERDKNPAMYPFELYQKAKAMLAAYATRAKVISKKPGWKRLRRRGERA